MIDAKHTSHVTFFSSGFGSLEGLKSLGLLGVGQGKANTLRILYIGATELALWRQIRLGESLKLPQMAAPFLKSVRCLHISRSLPAYIDKRIAKQT